ncbi:MAG: hypothetical protein GQ570_13070, partial [Helicobacteraceae bacterium]|nr:hypothetical protein [Helicobacteraceae bacterium]
EEEEEELDLGDLEEEEEEELDLGDLEEEEEEELDLGDLEEDASSSEEVIKSDDEFSELNALNVNDIKAALGEEVDEIEVAPIEGIEELAEIPEEQNIDASSDDGIQALRSLLDVLESSDAKEKLKGMSVNVNISFGE